jgi:hypothetical protein
VPKLWIFLEILLRAHANFEHQNGVLGSFTIIVNYDYAILYSNYIITTRRESEREENSGKLSLEACLGNQ